MVAMHKLGISFGWRNLSVNDSPCYSSLYISWRTVNCGTKEIPCFGNSHRETSHDMRHCALVKQWENDNPFQTIILLSDKVFIPHLDATLSKNVVPLSNKVIPISDSYTPFRQSYRIQTKFENNPFIRSHTLSDKVMPLSDKVILFQTKSCPFQTKSQNMDYLFVLLE